MKEMEKPTMEKLEELEKQTKDEFILRLILELKKEVDSSKYKRFLQLRFDKILELIEDENKKKELNKFNKSDKKNYKDFVYNLKIISKTRKKRDITLNGGFTLSVLSNQIQKEFDLEPMHLYEFEIGKYKFGPECDEWEEIFDSLDDIKIGAAISVAGLKEKDKFGFLYDFGDNIKFRIEIKNIEKVDLEIKNGK